MSWADLHPFIQEAGNTTLAVSALCLLVLMIRRPFAERFGAKAAYALWLVPLARFVMPPLPQSWSLSGWLGFGARSPEAVAPATVVEPTLTAPTQNMAVPIEAPQAVPMPTIETSVESSPFWATVLEVSLGFLSANWVGLAVLIWGFGALIWLGRGLRRQDVFMRLVRDDSEPAPADVSANAKLIANEIGLKRVPEVRMSLLCSGPLVTGLKNPVVLLPLWFKDDYTPSERRDALVHELMHLKRKDLWAFQIARVVVSTQWFNPLAHIALYAFRTDQEAACDADVLKQKSVSKAEYGRTLIKAARLARPSDRRFATASLTLAHPIKERIKLMTKPTPSLRSRLTGTAIAGVIGAGALFATASSMSMAQELQGGDETSQTFISDKSMISVTIDGETFTMDMSDLPPMPAMPPIPAVPEIAGLDFSGVDGNFNLHIDTEEMIANGDWEAFETAMEAWGEEMEAWGESLEVEGETFEVAMEAWGEEMEAWGEEFGESMEAWAEDAEPAIEAWAEGLAEKYEHKAEAKYQNREPENREFRVGDFDEVQVSSGLKVVYSQGPTATAEAVITRGDWDDVTIETKGNTLYVKRAKGYKWNNGKGPQVTVYATSKGLDTVDVSSGSVFEGDLVAKDLSVDASSGASVTLSGTCSSIEADASSGAMIKANAMTCERGAADASSGANVQIHASRRADADGSSGANITIYGGPTEVNSDKSSGAVVRIK